MVPRLDYVPFLVSFLLKVRWLFKGVLIADGILFEISNETLRIKDVIKTSVFICNLLYLTNF